LNKIKIGDGETNINDLEFTGNYKLISENVETGCVYIGDVPEEERTGEITLDLGWKGLLRTGDIWIDGSIHSEAGWSLDEGLELNDMPV
jgi:hypothetical protein